MTGSRWGHAKEGYPLQTWKGSGPDRVLKASGAHNSELLGGRCGGASTPDPEGSSLDRMAGLPAPHTRGASSGTCVRPGLTPVCLSRVSQGL